MIDFLIQLKFRENIKQLFKFIIKMYNDFQTYYYENIIVPYYDYIDEKQKGNFGRSNDIKKAIDCASKLYHLREHLSLQLVDEDIVDLCPTYKTIQDITNISKHKTLTRGTPEISSANQISELIIITIFKDDKGEFSDSDKVVQIIKNNGTKLFLHDILYKVVCFWDKYLYNNGLINKESKPKAPTPIGKVKRRYECKNLDLTVVQKMNFKMSMQMMKWDYEKNKAIPIDLTGKTVEFKVYKPKKPKLTPNIQIKNKKTGEISSLDINLTEEDLEKFNSFETDE